MPRKLKVYRTSIGFFELAVAAPSMKAAAEAWGADPDIFKRGFAEQTEDPNVVEATMAVPGKVLRRAVGSDDAFGEKAALPQAPKGGARKEPDHRVDNAEAKRKSDADAAEKTKREEAAAREREEKRLALERQKREAEEARARKREEMIAKANAVFEKAKARHEEAVKSLAKRRNELDEEEASETERWERERRELEDVLREAGRK